MPEHERFEELCALAASGQVTEEDWRELEEHLRSCRSCAETLGDFGKIGADLVSEFAATVPAGYLAEMRSRFLARARQEGTNLSEYPPAPSGAPAWRFPSMALTGAIAAAILLVLGGAYFKAHRGSAPATPSNATPLTGKQTPPEKPDTFKADTATIVAANQALERGRQLLETKLKAAVARQAELETRVEELSRESEAKSRELAAAESDKTLTTERLAETRTAFESAASKQAAQELQITLARAEVEKLCEQLAYEKANAEREKAVLAAGKDGQSILAARNLHIIDVYDADTRGKRKSFGRVFYVEGQELVFYAYDLSDPRHANVQFYAWGGGSASGEAIVRLGILHRDGQDEQRWVLKYSDPSILAKLDSIFVTAETANDPEKPKGRHVLYAVLTGQPNHP
jgi:hypothetical protein